MDDFTPLPESISHKQLISLLKTAQPNPINQTNDIIGLNSERKDFEKLLSNWSLISENLLKKLEQKPDYIFEGKSSKSIMALGALQTHLSIAIQALKASEND